MDHPLAHLLHELTDRGFARVGLREPDLPRYVSELLLEFTHVDRLYCIRDARGRRLEDVGEMLLEGDLRHRARSIERERSVRKHIGDFTLFFTGMFPEHVESNRRWWRLDRFVDWIEAGRESYRIVGAFDMGPHAREAPLFRKLADHFDFMVVGLNFVREDLVRMRDDRFAVARSLIDPPPVN